MRRQRPGGEGIEIANPLKGIFFTRAARMRLHALFIRHENIHATRVVVRAGIIRGRTGHNVSELTSENTSQ